MGCYQSKIDVATTNLPIKIKRKSRKSKAGKGENAQLIPQQNEGVEGSICDENVANEKMGIEDVICDGISGKTEYYSPKKSDENDAIDDVEVEDKEVLVEVKIGETKNNETEDLFGEEEYLSPKKLDLEVEEYGYYLSKEKVDEIKARVSVTHYAFDTLLSFWRTREV